VSKDASAHEPVYAAAWRRHRERLDTATVENDYATASDAAAELAALLLDLGELHDRTQAGKPASGALTLARASIHYADLAGDISQRSFARALMACAMFNAGKIDEAERAFQDAERLHHEARPDLAFMPGLAGAFYGELLLARGRVEEARTRASHTRTLAQAAGFEDHALRDAVTLVMAGEGPALADDARAHAITEWETALCLFSKAVAQHRLGDATAARATLEETAPYALAGGMKGLLCDMELLRARITLEAGDPGAAIIHLANARRYITAHSLERRAPLAALTAAEIAVARGADDADALLHAAVKSIGEGWFALLPRLEAAIGARPGFTLPLQTVQSAAKAYAARSARAWEDQRKPESPAERPGMAALRKGLAALGLSEAQALACLENARANSSEPGAFRDAFIAAAQEAGAAAAGALRFLRALEQAREERFGHRDLETDATALKVTPEVLRAAVSTAGAAAEGRQPSVFLTALKEKLFAAGADLAATEKLVAEFGLELAAQADPAARLLYPAPSDLADRAAAHLAPKD
jgi:hypothetical protein